MLMWRDNEGGSAQGASTPTPDVTVSRGIFRGKAYASFGLAVALVATTAGCASPDPEPDPDPAPSAVVAESSQPPATEEPASTPMPEETDVPEGPVAGDAGVAIELAGLPVGGGLAAVVDGAWCQVLAWGEQIPEGVVLEIDAVAILEEGASLVPGGCDAVPPCVGRVVAAGDSQSCSVLVAPPSAQTPALTVRLDGTLRCPDRQTCETLGEGNGSQFRIDNPGGGDSDDDGGTGGDVDPSSTDLSDTDPGDTGTGDTGTGQQDDTGDQPDADTPASADATPTSTP